MYTKRETPATDFLITQNRKRDWRALHADFVLRQVEIEQKIRQNDLIEEYLKHAYNIR